MFLLLFNNNRVVRQVDQVSESKVMELVKTRPSLCGRATRDKRVARLRHSPSTLKGLMQSAKRTEHNKT